MNVKSYSKDIQRKTERLLKKMFGYKDIKTALHETKELKMNLESWTTKKVEEITIADCKSFYRCYCYVKYRTLKKIIDLYLDSVSLGNFIIEEYEEYVK